MEKHYCQDVGEPGCLTEADEQYTMDYSDVGGMIYWCSYHGPQAQAFQAFLHKTLEQGGLVMAQKLEQELDAIEASITKH